MLLSPDQVAARFGVRAHTIRRAIRLGNLPAVRMGRLWRISEEVADAAAKVGLPALSGEQRHARPRTDAPGGHA